MDYEKLLEAELAGFDSRLKHTKGVRDRALELGTLYKADLEALEVASLLHDITKCYSVDEHIKLIKDHKRLNILSPVMYHAESAYEYAKSKGISDPRTLEAIRYHMWGKEDMYLETMILCVADYCEPNRHFKEAEDVYQLALKDIKEAYLKALESTMNHLIKNNKTPHDEQVRVYLYYKERK